MANRSFSLKTILACAFAAGLWISPIAVMAVEEKPANLGDQDHGKTLPISLMRGRVTSQSSRYILGPGDKIAIKIKDLDQFNQSFSVRPDGYATIHPFGERLVSGTDVQGLQSWLEQEFKFYLLKPQIAVDIEKMRPAMIYVNGAVRHPGTYQFVRSASSTTSEVSNPLQEGVEITLTNVLGKAGGFQLNADINQIQIQHASTGVQETFNLRDFLTQGGTTDKDIWLLPEDTVTVPEAPQPMDAATFKLLSTSTYFRDKFPVVVLGAVQKQGEVQMDPTNNTLNAAIAQAGGFISALSKRDSIIVQRPSNHGGFSRWVIDRNKNNLELLPGDVVYVSDSKAASFERGLKVLTSMTQPYFFGLSGTNVLKNQLIQSPLP